MDALEIVNKNKPATNDNVACAPVCRNPVYRQQMVEISRERSKAKMVKEPEPMVKLDWSKNNPIYRPLGL